MFVRGHLAERLFTGFGLRRGVALGLEQAGQQPADVAFVVDDQDASHRAL